MSNKSGLEVEKTDLLEKVRPELKRPPMYQVVMMNDDYTPMDFVVLVLESFFGMTTEAALRVMLDVHQKGQGYCGIYTRDVAETKIALAMDFARQHEYPLLCKIEKI